MSSWGNQIQEQIAWGNAVTKAKQLQGRTDILCILEYGINRISKRIDEKRLKNVTPDNKDFDHYTSREYLMYFTGYNDTCLDSFIVFFNSKYNVNNKMKSYDLLATISDAYKGFKDLYQDTEWYACDSIQVQ